MVQQDLGGVARTIIDSIVYMVLGTANESGRPWGSPVYFASENYRDFYWMSSPDATHSRNISRRPEISIVIFDSQVTVGMGQAVYMEATAEELTGSDIDRAVDIYNGRFQNPTGHNVRIIAPEDVRDPSPYRLYRATATTHWILDPEARSDQRVQVTV